MAEAGGNRRSFKWDQRKELAASLLATSQLTDAEIAAKSGIQSSTLYLWKQHPEFKARVDEHIQAYRQAVRSRGIAVLENRIDSLNTRWNLMHRVIEERSEEMKDEIAGGGTGLLVRDYKSIGSGEYAEKVEVYRVDTGLLREMREHEKQAAQELGQWTERADVTSAGEPIGIVTEIVVSPIDDPDAGSGSPDRDTEEEPD